MYQDHKNSPLMNYDIVGYVVVGVSCLSIVLMYRVNQLIKTKRWGSCFV